MRTPKTLHDMLLSRNFICKAIVEDARLMVESHLSNSRKNDLVLVPAREVPEACTEEYQIPKRDLKDYYAIYIKKR